MGVRRTMVDQPRIGSTTRKYAGASRVSLAGRSGSNNHAPGLVYKARAIATAAKEASGWPAGASQTEAWKPTRLKQPPHRLCSKLDQEGPTAGSLKHMQGFFQRLANLLQEPNEMRRGLLNEMISLSDRG